MRWQRVETEHVLDLPGGDAAPGVRHLEQHLLVLALQRHRYRPARFGVLQGVAQQLPQGPPQVRPVHGRHMAAEGALHTQRYAPQLEQRLGLQDQGLCPFHQFRVLGGQRRTAGQQRRGVQFVGQPQQAEIALQQHGRVVVQFRIFGTLFSRRQTACRHIDPGQSQTDLRGHMGHHLVKDLFVPIFVSQSLTPFTRSSSSASHQCPGLLVLLSALLTISYQTGR